MSTLEIELRDVWKVFGVQQARALSAVRDGNLGKDALLEQFDNVLAVAGASLSIKRGEIFCVMGLSGSGKSTLVRHINRLIEPTAGQILIGGEDISTFSDEQMRRLRAEKLGMVFQNMALFPHRSVLDNVALGLEVRGISRTERMKMAKRALELVELDGWGWKKPQELSGGMQQRVGLARAMAADPNILLLDEPFSALDPLIRRQLQDQFLSISKVQKKTTVFITHDLDEAIRIGDRIAIMKDGRVVQVGTPEDIVTNPTDAYVAEFVAGISRLKLVTAGRIMTPGIPAETRDWQHTHVDASIDELIDLSIETGQPIVVLDHDDNAVGTVDKDTLLRGIQGGKDQDSKAAEIETTSTKVQVDPKSGPDPVGAFVERSIDFYKAAFKKIAAHGLKAFSFNAAAALIGPIFLAIRGLWLWCFLAAFIETYAFIQIIRGTFTNLGADQIARADSLQERAGELAEQAAAALAEGKSSLAESLATRGERLLAGADDALARAAEAQSQSGALLLTGVLALLGLRVLLGLFANHLYFRQFSKWQVEADVPSGVSVPRGMIAALLTLAFYPQMIIGFALEDVAAALPNLFEVPANLDVKATISNTVDGWVESTSIHGAFLFDGISAAVRNMLDAIEFVVLQTPWPIVAMTVLLLAWRVGGAGLAGFSGLALFYLGYLGYWIDAMTTVALLGTATIICCALGIPIGIWFGKNERAYRIFQPVLDFMQSMPAFVYLIPVIAFFGIGKPPAILATLIFGMPPVIRLTALGIQQVPHDVKEAAVAFGATKPFVLMNVELPLSVKSIMAGVNQTTLMCLSMVVIAALIGAKGLGQLILQSLQYAAEGEGILAGIAILFCAMVIDRIIQGSKKTDT